MAGSRGWPAGRRAGEISLFTALRLIDFPAVRCRMKIAFPARLDHTRWAPCRRRHLAQSCFGLFLFWDLNSITDIAGRNSRPRRSVPPVGSRISDGKNGGRASKGDCRSAGLRPLRGACRNAFDHGAIAESW